MFTALLAKGGLAMVLGVAVTALACASGPTPETRAQSCFELLSKGDTDGATACVRPDKRTTYGEQVKRMAVAMKGCAEQVSKAEVKRSSGNQTEVLVSFKQPCGEPGSDFNGRKVVGVGIGIEKAGNDLWVVNYERVPG